MTTPAPDHATHDPELVAAHLDGRLDPADLDRVDGWLAACGACAVLHDDLQDLVLATRALPTPSRPRDFALSPEDARRARSGGWRRLVAAIGSPRDTVSRPLAVGLTTLGLAGLLVANVPSALARVGRRSAAPAPQMRAGRALRRGAGASWRRLGSSPAAGGEHAGRYDGRRRRRPVAAEAVRHGHASPPTRQRDGSANELYTQAWRTRPPARPVLARHRVARDAGRRPDAGPVPWRARRLGDG